MRIPEKYLRHIWQNVYFERTTLCTTDGQPLKILSPGDPNFNEGPDFLNAKIFINDAVIYGSVEIHFQTSDWLKHRHSESEKYEQVILHVVFEHDAQIDVQLPVFEMGSFLNQAWHEVLQQAIADENRSQAEHLLICFPLLANVSDKVKLDCIKRLSLARFERKAAAIAEKRDQFCYDELIYQGLVRALGYSENTAPMERLAQKMPFQELQPFSAEMLSVRKAWLESIFFSLSGLPNLTEPCDDASEAYIDQVRTLFQQTKFSGLSPLGSKEWVFFRLRPNNFPTLRVAGLVEILSKNLQNGFLKKAEGIVKMPLPPKRKILFLEAIFEADADGFWQTHYRFCKKSKHKIGKLVGKNRASEIVINTLLPAMLSFYLESDDETGIRQIKALYECYPKKLSSEIAKGVLDELFGEDYTINSAMFEQGILELKKNYCEKQACLACEIGQVALGRAHSSSS